MRISLLFVVLIISKASLAAGPMKIEDCPAPDTSTMFDACVNEVQTAELNLKLTKKIQDLLRGASAYEKKALIDSQKAWVNYREKTCIYQQAARGGIVSINLVRCTRDLTEERLRYFESL